MLHFVFMGLVVLRDYFIKHEKTDLCNGEVWCPL
jgi:hypothetical protein